MPTWENRIRASFARVGPVGLIALWMVVGCGGSAPVAKEFPVEGAIRWADGTDAGQLAGGSVEFEGGGAVAAKADIIADGTFTLKTAPPAGKYKVRVMPPGGKSLIDPKYQDFSKSGIVIDVGSEPKQVNINVSKPR